MSKPTIKQRAREEIRNFVYIAIYLFVCFAVLMFFESTLTDSANTGVFSLGAAAIKAAILAKFILIGDALGIGDKSHAPRLVGSIVTKGIQLWLLLILLTAIEELVVGRLHGHAFAATWAEYRQQSVASLFAKSLVVLLILLPLIATRELSRSLGPGVLREMLVARQKD